MAQGTNTQEYQVEHPPWQILPAEKVVWDCDAQATYGHEFTEALSTEPSSAFLALGSKVAVRWGNSIHSQSEALANSGVGGTTLQIRSQEAETQDPVTQGPTCQRKKITETRN